MATTILGLFSDSKMAGEAVSELKSKGYTKEISLLAYDDKKHDADLHKIKEDVSAGAVTGALAAIFSGITAITIPAVGVLVGGPLALLLGVAGGAIGSLAGGLLGALVDLGINEPAAKIYDEKIRAGEILVGVTTEGNTGEEIHRILTEFGAHEVSTIEK